MKIYFNTSTSTFQFPAVGVNNNSVSFGWDNETVMMYPTSISISHAENVRVSLVTVKRRPKLFCIAIPDGEISTEEIFKREVSITMSMFGYSAKPGIAVLKNASLVVK